MTSTRDSSVGESSNESKEWDEDGWHAMHNAALDGDVKQLKALIGRGALLDIETKPGTYGKTPLIIAAQAGELEAMELLLDCKANIDKQEARGRTALITAVTWMKPKSVRVLLERGANRGARVTSDTFTGQTALEIAQTRFPDQKEMITMLEALPAPEAPPAPFPANAGQRKLSMC